MHASVMEFLRTKVSPNDIISMEVLEVGSQDVNGSPREIFIPYSPLKYIGVDFAKGKGVDLVMDVSNISDYFGLDRFDTVISTEMLEHAQDWREAVRQMKLVLRMHGLLVITTRGPGFPYHGYPHDYWRFRVEDFQKIFSDMEIELLCPDTSPADPGVFLKARKKSRNFVDLSKIDVPGVT